MKELQYSTARLNMLNAFAAFLQEWIREAPQNCNCYQPDAVHYQHTNTTRQSSPVQRNGKC